MHLSSRPQKQKNLRDLQKPPTAYSTSIGVEETMLPPSTDPVPPFLGAPAEIRLIIYKLLLSDHDDKSLGIRTEDHSTYARRKGQERQRRRFRYIQDRMRSGSGESTYCLTKSPGLYPSILGANRQIYSEASHVLYSHTFDFGLDIESILSFLRDLTPTALSSIRRISMMKRSHQ